MSSSSAPMCASVPARAVSEVDLRQALVVEEVLRVTWTPARVEEATELWLKHRSGTEIALFMSDKYGAPFTKNSII